MIRVDPVTTVQRLGGEALGADDGHHGVPRRFEAGDDSVVEPRDAVGQNAKARPLSVAITPSVPWRGEGGASAEKGRLEPVGVVLLLVEDGLESVACVGQTIRLPPGEPGAGVARRLFRRLVTRSPSCRSKFRVAQNVAAAA